MCVKIEELKMSGTGTCYSGHGAASNQSFLSRTQILSEATCVTWVCTHVCNCMLFKLNKPVVFGKPI